MGAKSALALSMFSIVSRSPRRWRAFPPTAITMRSHAGRVVEYERRGSCDVDADDDDAEADDDDDDDDAAAAARSSKQDAVFRREHRPWEIMMARCYYYLYWCFYEEYGSHARCMLPYSQYSGVRVDGNSHRGAAGRHESSISFIFFVMPIGGVLPLKLNLGRRTS